MSWAWFGELLLTAGATGLIAGGGITWWIRRVADHQLERSLIKLRAETDRESLLFSIRYEPIFAKQAEVLIDLYPKIDDLIFHGKTLVDFGELSSRADQLGFQELHAECRRMLLEAAVFLPDELDSLLESTLNSIRKVVNKGYRATQGVKQGSESVKRRAYDDQNNASDELDALLRKVRTELRLQIRSALGLGGTTASSP
jgi:hypothetical protein